MDCHGLTGFNRGFNIHTQLSDVKWNLSWQLIGQDKAQEYHGLYRKEW